MQRQCSNFRDMIDMDLGRFGSDVGFMIMIVAILFK